MPSLFSLALVTGSGILRYLAHISCREVVDLEDVAVAAEMTVIVMSIPVMA